MLQPSRVNKISILQWVYVWLRWFNVVISCNRVDMNHVLRFYLEGRDLLTIKQIWGSFKHAKKMLLPPLYAERLRAVLDECHLFFFFFFLLFLYHSGICMEDFTLFVTSRVWVFDCSCLYIYICFHYHSGLYTMPKFSYLGQITLVSIWFGIVEPKW